MAIGVLVTYCTAAVAAPDPATCAAIGGEVQGNVCIPTSGTTGLSDRTPAQIVEAIAMWIVGIFGTIALITFLICGLKYIFAGASASDAEVAKRCMGWAIVGAFIVALSFAIIKTIASILSG